MKIYFPLLLFFALACSLTSLRAQVCTSDNHALAFDGNGDYIELNPINNLPATSDFTAEAWFTSTATSGPTNFKRLFSFGGPAGTQLELGEENGFLTLIWQNNFCLVFFPLQIHNISIRDGMCHHIALVRNGMNYEVFLDGVSIYAATANCLPAVTLFRVGQWPGGTTGNQEWQGLIDEIRLWNHARTPAQITQFQHCLLNGQEAGLVAYWQLDQGIANGNNTSPLITHALDASPNGNNGMLFNFGLTGTTSNFVPSCAPSVYPNYNNLDVIIQDLSWSVYLIAICEGDPVHFSLQCNGNPVPPAGGNVTVNWEYKDGKLGPWFGLGPANGFPNGFSFLVSQVNANCSNGISHVDRYYRAQIIVDDGLGHTCTYTTREAELRICCPITGALQVTSSPPGPLCEGDQASFTVSLTTNMPAPDPSNNVHINWCIIDGTNPPIPLPGFDDMLSFNYPIPSGTIPVSSPSLCFKAVISNCACPPLTLTECVQVDLKPVCTNLQIYPVYSIIQPDPTGGPNDYLICPGQQETLAYSGNFQNCNPTWQYYFDTDPPGSPNWQNLGSSNPWQNTNTLPQYPPPVSPQNWPPNANCIYYRIACLPFNYPNSACLPCYSTDTLSICLRPNNLLTPVISINPNPICENDPPATIKHDPPPDPVAIQTQWFCNGLSTGPPTPPFGSSITSSDQACYQLSVTDGCYTKFSNRECLIVCDPVAIIKCPVDNLCACLNMPSTFDGSMSYSNCGPIMKYEWKVLDWATGVTQVFTGATLDMLVYTVPAGGASITLCITDNNQCMEISKTLDIKPCE